MPCAMGSSPYMCHLWPWSRYCPAIFTTHLATPVNPGQIHCRLAPSPHHRPSLSDHTNQCMPSIPPPWDSIGRTRCPSLLHHTPRSLQGERVDVYQYIPQGNLHYKAMGATFNLCFNPVSLYTSHSLPGKPQATPLGQLQAASCSRSLPAPEHQPSCPHDSPRGVAFPMPLRLTVPLYLSPHSLSQPFLPRSVKEEEEGANWMEAGWGMEESTQVLAPLSPSCAGGLAATAGGCDDLDMYPKKPRNTYQRPQSSRREAVSGECILVVD
jgi:hypothetical protein